MRSDAIYCRKCRARGELGRKKAERVYREAQHKRFMGGVWRAKPFLVETPLLPMEAAELIQSAKRGHVLSPEQVRRLLLYYCGPAAFAGTMEIMDRVAMETAAESRDV